MWIFMLKKLVLFRLMCASFSHTPNHSSCSCRPCSPAGPWPGLLHGGARSGCKINRDRCVSSTGERSFGGNEIAADLPKKDWFLTGFSLARFLFMAVFLQGREGAGPWSLSGLVGPCSSTLGHCCPQAASPHGFPCHLPGCEGNPWELLTPKLAQCWKLLEIRLIQ